MTTRTCLVALVATTLLACGHNSRASRTVLERASFDFPCPKDEIELIVIDEEGARNLASQIAAYGCSHKAVYVFFPDADTWVLNGSVSEAHEAHPLHAYHGKRTSRKEDKAEKKADKSAKKAGKEVEDVAPTPADVAPTSAQ